MRAYIASIVAMILLHAPAVQAQGLDDATSDIWKIAKISGSARIETPGHEPMWIKKGRVLFAGQTLMTGARTRLQMTNGKQRIQVGSNTELSLPGERERNPNMTVIRQKKGTITLAVDKQKRQHFQVETPYMVAAVKGTEFTVSIDDKWAKVRVHEGVVEVRNKLEAEVYEVKAGETTAMNIASLNADTSARAKSLNLDQIKEIKASSGGHMAFVERGGTDPEVLYLHEEKLAQEREKSSFIGRVLSLTSGLLFILSLAFGFITDGLSILAHWSGDILLLAMSPFFDVSHGLAGLSYWARSALIGICAVLVIGGGSVYWFILRRR